MEPTEFSEANPPGEPALSPAATPGSEVEAAGLEESQEPPTVRLAADVACPVEEGTAGVLTVEVAAGSATVTDLLATTSGEPPFPLPSIDPTLPLPIAGGTARIEWGAARPPDALLVRIAELPGDESAATLAGDTRRGWLVVPLPTAEDRCVETPAEPAPIAEDRATPAPDATADPATEATTPETPASAADEPTATPTPEGEAEPVILVKVRSSDRVVEAGQPNHFVFDVTNPSDGAVAVRLEAQTTTPGWTAGIYRSRGGEAISEPIPLAAGETLRVFVKVTAPTTARPGEQNTTRLVAHVVEPQDEPAIG